MNAMTSMALCEQTGVALAGVSKSYRGRRALDDVSLSVARGSLTVILGAAGAGKTTLLRTIAGLEWPDRGQIRIAGRDVDDLEPKDRNVAMIFDNLALYPDKTGFENIASPLRIAGLDRTSVETRVQDIASKLRIAHVLGRKPKTMSGGERQRIALGRAFVREPSLFLLDEPLSSLDAMLRIELRAELRRLQKEFGYTFLLATPDFAEAMAVADTVVFLREGHIVQVSDPQTLYDEPFDWDIARFVGAPEINLLAASFSPSDGGQVSLEGATFRAPAALRRGDDRSAFEFMAGIRPEHLRLEPPDQGLWRVEIIDIELLGLKAAMTIALGRSEVRVLAAAASVQEFKSGNRAGLSLSEDKLIAFDADTKARIV
jgi:ABC-type sugar transport system ATPase subunit